MHDKKYLVKVYKSGAFKGILPYTVEDFSFRQEINSAGCELEIKLGTDLKASGVTVNVNYLSTSTRNHITDNNGNRIITSRDYALTNVPFDLASTIELWLYYSGAPNGKRVFSGLVSKWRASEQDATITVTALSYGVQLDNYLIKTVPGSDIIRQSVSDTSDSLYVLDYGATHNRNTRAAQTFTVPLNTSIGQVSLGLRRNLGATQSYYATVQVYEGPPTATVGLIAAGSVMVTQTDSHALTVTLNNPATLVQGTTYTLMVTTDGGPDYSILIDRDSTGSYANGSAYMFNDVTGWATVPGDFAFSVSVNTASVGNQFLSFDPSDILSKVIDSEINSGGTISYATNTIDKTNSIVSYTFKYDTILDGVKKCLELAPPNWYWYIDVGTNLLHFHKFLLSPTYTFTKGDEIEDLDVEYSIETIKNSVLYTGGDNPAATGTNIISQSQNNVSVGRYGQWLAKDSDSRVTLQATADILASNILGENSQPVFSATATIVAGRFDIEQLQIGQMISFRNFNDLTNSLVLQIVALARTPDSAQVTLASLPPTQAHRIEDIKRNLDNLTTANNPVQ